MEEREGQQNWRERVEEAKGRAESKDGERKEEAEKRRSKFGNSCCY